MARLHPCQSTGPVGPSNPQLPGGERTRSRSGSRCTGSGTARAQVVQAVSDNPRAQYNVLERGDADCENPRVEYSVDSSVSRAAQGLTGPLAHSQRGQPLFAALCSNSRAALKQFNFNGLHFWFS